MKQETKTIHEKDGKKDMTFEEVFWKYRPLCDSMASFYARRCDWVEKDDLKQMAYIALWVGFTKYDPARTVGFAHFVKLIILGWLQRYIKSSQYSVLRHAGLESIYTPIDVDEDDLTLFETLKADINVEELAIANAEIDRIYKTITNEKNIKIVQYLIQGWSQRKIGKKLGISAERVCQRVSKIKKKLKEVL